MNTKYTYYTLETAYSVALSFTKATFMLFFLSYALTKQEAALLFSVFNITVVIAEPFTAPYAEIFGARKSLIIGCLLKIVTALLFITGTNFSLFLIAEVVSGISVTFISGSLTAWAVNRLRSENSKEELYEIFNRCDRYKYVALIGGGLFGAFIGSKSLVFPWIANGLSFILLMFAIIALMPKENVTDRKSIFDFSRISKGYKIAFSDRSIMFLIISSFVSSLSLTPIMLFFLPSLKENFAFPIWAIGYAWALISIANWLGTHLVKSIVKRFPHKLDSLRFLSLYSTALIFMVAITLKSYWTLLFYFLFELLKPIYSSVKDDLINYQVGNDGRITLNSFHSLVSKLGSVVGVMLFGFFAENIGSDFSWYLAALMFVTNYIFYTMARKFISEKVLTPKYTR